MKFRAKKVGIFESRRIRAGEVFVAPDTFSALWAEPLDEKPAEPEPSADSPPVRKKAAKKKSKKKKVATSE